MPSPGRPAPGGEVFVGRAFGIPIYLGPSWFFVIALLTVLYAPDVRAAVDGIGRISYLVSLGFALLLYVSVLVHELGHSLVARAFGLPVRRITLHAFVGLSEIEKEPPTPSREAVVAAAGPAMSLAVAGLAGLCVPLLARGTVPRVLAVGLVLANVLITILNLLPGLPLDGGRVLRAAVWAATRRPLAGTVVAAWAGRLVGLGVALAGLVWGMSGGGGIGVYNVLVTALVGAFIYAGATSSLRAARVAGALPRLQARALTRPALPVGADLPLAEALRQLREARARAMVVVDSAGTPLAIVSEAAVAAVPEERRPWVSVGTLSRTLAPGASIDADLAGGELLAALQARPAEDHLVTSGGRVYGVLNTSDVAAVVSGASSR